MSWFDWSSETPEGIGDEILQAYFFESQVFEEFARQFSSYSDFVAWAERATNLRYDMGEIVLNTSLTNSKSSAISRVQDLARKSFGQAKQGDIFKAAGGSGNEINWFVFVPAVSQDVASGVLEEGLDIAQSIGTGVTGSLKMLKYLPFILLGAGALWIVANKSTIKSLAGGLKKKNPSPNFLKALSEINNHWDRKNSNTIYVWCSDWYKVSDVRVLCKKYKALITKEKIDKMSGKIMMEIREPKS